jgi:hypothetical protein
LVTLLIFIAIISVPLLIVHGNIHFKHGLEWNYFIGVILFYLLSNFFWKKKVKPKELEVLTPHNS